MNTYIFRSGIRKITIKSVDFTSAAFELLEYVPDAWIDKTWNWKIEVIK